ncbi:MAG TPA: dienelactone hydrolase family protein [Candidatus Angelobacter sp.]|nr:dienelactone hydrolase family protein [Candidatus Angelobacter sp.]
MGTYVQLTASDGHHLQAYCAGDEKVQRALVVIQEIFGVNSHIRSVADDFAQQGFLAIAPALFDRAEPGLELGYDTAAMQKGMRAATQIGMEAALKDVAAAIGYAGQKSRKVGVVGYCFGGSLAWLAATRLDPSAAVGYYGGRIAQSAAESPRCPVMLHFGAKDPHIGAKEIETIRRHHPDLPLFLYDAGHGFNCDQRKDYEPQSAALARQRTLKFLNQYLQE